MTHKCSRQLPPTLVADSGLDETDLAGLELVRLICVAYSGKQPGAWEFALELAENRFGETDGPALFAAVRCFMATIRSTRASCFDFMNPWCEECSLHVTGHELALLTLIAAAKRQDAATARGQAIVVMEGRPSEELLIAARRVGRVMRELDGPTPSGHAHARAPGWLERLGASKYTG